ATRSHTLLAPTSDTNPILTAARSLLTAAGPLIAEQGITLVGVAISNLDDADAIQLELPFRGHELGLLDSAVDHVRDKFGSKLITRASLMGHDPGLTVPLLPD